MRNIFKSAQVHSFVVSKLAVGHVTLAVVCFDEINKLKIMITIILVEIVIGIIIIIIIII
jgi:MoxR-like ATPase